MSLSTDRILTRNTIATGFDFQADLATQTSHFSIYYATSLSASDGNKYAQYVAQQCEKDYTQLQSFFANVTIPDNSLPFNILVGPNIPGAYHHGCSDTDLYCDAVDDPEELNMLVVAEEVEVFEAVQGKGWDCGATNGEALSRALAEELHTTQNAGFLIAPAWINSRRRDYISTNESTDQDTFANACGLLFLNWLHTKLAYSWTDIVQQGAPTLGQTYAALTGKPASQAFTDFLAAINQLFPAGTTADVTTNNPFRQA
ncbi:hypothetical protein KDK_63760 [Dictyobacter kobayashii]|uniref:Uncharacterized protein n=2 Tax=Dictyobacter kobayashii TaxID=2014872 RepID=A0A402ATT7_9CHLR|nr:hypothetical protein KDK_63760 [Dictyobacter kobayashii]